MPRSEVTEVTEDDLYGIPEEYPCPAELLSCIQVTIPFKRKNPRPGEGLESSFDKWEWRFRITDGDYAGLEVQGSTEPKITNAPEATFLPLAKPYVEALLGRELDLGESIDTDDLIGLPCQITARHMPKRPKKEGDGYWYNVEVNEIFPAYGTAPARNQWTAASAGAPADEPPF